ncbi:alpha/beta hydrolase [Dactylosporangium sp. CA-092794]|uniref:alpha/beta hydrolase n=1 Tax=Dactylosporangium sp. CA-092794 TaxID=3239929 RepID=UPI003D93667F
MTYALVHGAWHAGWHWQLVAEELRRRGRRAVAVDLPADAGALAAAEAVAAALGDDDTGPVTVVAHSMGGLVAPVVADRLARAEAVVFVAGLLPALGTSWDEQVAAAERGSIILRGLSDGQAAHGDDSSSWADEDKAIARFYADAPPGLARSAAARLRRQYWTVMHETCPLPAWPDVEYRSIVCTHDRVVSPEWSRRTFRDRFHRAAVDLDSDHSPFLSHPAALVDLLPA